MINYCKLYKSRTLSHDIVLKCSVCMQFVHIKCIPLKRDEYKCIKDRNCPWQCKPCNEDAIPFYYIDDDEEFTESLYTFYSDLPIDLSISNNMLFNPFLTNKNFNSPLMDNYPDINFYNDIQRLYADNSPYLYGGAILILLDLSAAFDTIDHTILLQRRHELGIRDAALDWFKSYLSQRRQSVVINGTRSSHRNLSFGVPQGSVLGPILFTLYTTPLGAIARKYQLNFHIYADGTQLYMSFKPNNAESLPLVISNIQNCVVDIKSWMTANMLQLNMNKTEVLVLMNKSLRNPTTMNKIKIDSIDISTASSVRNLGGIFGSALSSEAFVNSICKSAWFNLFNISRSRRSLTTDAAKILIQAYVMSKIDYCNSLLYGIPDKLLNRIQRIQNYAARVVLRLHKFSHITPALATLHWLPVKRRIDFKIALLVYKALNGQAPAYITDLLQPYDPPRKLRSADKQLLSQPPCRLKSYGDCAFCCAAPVVWNNIPHSVKTAKTIDNFKVKLKTHFYSVSFA